MEAYAAAAGLREAHCDCQAESQQEEYMKAEV
jgi:hypothetical protein